MDGLTELTEFSKKCESRYFLRRFAYLVTFGFFGALVLLFLPISFNSQARELLSMLIGMLASKWQTIIDFFYGSSRKDSTSGKGRNINNPNSKEA